MKNSLGDSHLNSYSWIRNSKYLLVVLLFGCSDFKSVRTTFFKEHTFDVINLANENSKYVLASNSISDFNKNILINRNNLIIEDAILMYNEAMELHNESE